MAEAEAEDRPLALTRVHPSSSSNEEDAVKTMLRKRRIKLCGWVTLALLLVHVIVIVILALTVFKVKDPKVKIKGITITNLDVEVVQTSTPQVNLNMSMIIGMSIKNPNVASFKISNTSTTTMYYRGVAVGDAGIPSVNVKARHTTAMNVTVVVLADRLASIPDLYEDVIVRGKMNMSTYSVIKGRVKIWFIKKHAKVKMNCTMTITISRRDIEDLSCKYKVKL